VAEKYIPAKTGYNKLQFTDNSNTTVYIYGATGYGKSRMVKEYTKRRKALWLSGGATEWNLENLTEGSAVIIDDLQLLTSETQKQRILELAGRTDIWLILIGRMQFPQWMYSMITDGKVVIISEEDLWLNAEEIKKIADNRKIPVTEKEAQRIALRACGNAMVVSLLLQMMQDGKPLDDTLEDKLGVAFAEYLENYIIVQWNIDLQEFLMQISVVDSFTLPMAVMITGDDKAALMLEEAFRIGNFIEKTGETYTIREYLILALRRRAHKVFGQQKYMSYVRNAGLYYETHDDLVNALRMYAICEEKDKVRSILIRNGRRHMGNGKIYELRRYYLALEEEEADGSIVLMSSLSMLYSVMMNEEKSEYWYQKIKDYSKTVKGGEKREAEEMLLYLDIALPHRGSVDILDILKKVIPLVTSGGIHLPEFSVTNNQPGIMVGGKDFCSWSKRDEFLANTIGKPLEKLMGAYGRGMVHASLCESFYEKGGRDSEMLNHAMQSQMEIEGGGRLEILFATVGVQVRYNMISGKHAQAISLLNAFERRLAQEDNPAMKANFRALRCRVNLMLNDRNAVQQWLLEAPDELQEFWTLERYRYMTKVLCYLELGQNLEAINLLNRVRYYADLSKRPYIRMETGLLQAIAYKREGQEWKAVMLESLEAAKEYHFVRVISEKGAGILALLQEIKEDYLATEGADAKWFQKVLKETKVVAERYSGYLKIEMAQPADFSENSLTILRMQAEGYSIKEIAASLGASERTVKYHAAENYRKLEAKGKTDAVQKARSMNLI